MRQDHRGALEWLRERRDKSKCPLITADEYQAGVRLRSDFHIGQMLPRVTSSWSATAEVHRQRVAPDQRAELLDHTVAGRERVRRALSAIEPEYVGLLIDVCCFDAKLGDVERRSGWPQRSGKLVLQFALRQLARHYGIISRRKWVEPDVSRIMHWGCSDYRPLIDPAADDSDVAI